MCTLSIVIPSYNEKPNIEPLFRLVSDALPDDFEYEVIFVDDSSDDTPQFLEEFSRREPRVRYLHRTDKTGLASAVIEGFAMAKGEVIAVMDADLQHPPSLLPAMYAAVAGGADIVLPTRFSAGGGSEGLSPVRTLASKSARLASQIFLKAMRKVTDPMSGFFMLRRSVIQDVRLEPLGWKILMEILVMGKYRSVVEIPFTFEKRHAGESKLSCAVTAHYFMHILSLVRRSERDRRFFLFALVGLSGVVVDMLVFWATRAWWTPSINAAATISAIVAMVSNYFLNRTITWRQANKDRACHEFARYVATACAGIGIKNVCIIFLVRLGLSGGWSNLAGIAVACLWNYTIDTMWVFREDAGSGEESVVYLRR
ncbi:MAG: glycosyltransferase family 2 protein [Planctomycetaceae bacterium]|nr:glycosyltransferase family 2 protein [Planctomycetaceae bacterium]